MKQEWAERVMQATGRATGGCGPSRRFSWPSTSVAAIYEVAHARARVRGYPFSGPPYNQEQAGAIAHKRRQK